MLQPCRCVPVHITAASGSMLLYCCFFTVVQGLLHITHLDLSFSLSGKSLPIPGTSSGGTALAWQVKLRPAMQFAKELRSAIAKLHSLQGVCQCMLGMIPVLAFGGTCHGL